ncbi:MAG: ABC transporter permease [Chloroflexota bacterium]|jgi:peptide/nickel transport system permease protein
MTGLEGTPQTAGHEGTRRSAEALRYVRRHPGLVVSMGIVVLVVGAALLAPLIAPFPEDAGTATNMLATLLPPGGEHPLGTDQVGRDVFSRVLFGTWWSVGASLLVIAASLAVGVPIGLLSGSVGGWLDAVLMRVVDIFLAFPSLLLALAIGSALGPSLEHAAAAIVVAWWPWYARLMRGEAASIRRRAFIESGRLLGISHLRLATRHILPNAAGPVIVQASLDLGGVILTLAGLSFLGLGARDPTPEWGLMVEQGRTFFSTHPWVALAPGAAIMLAALAFTLLGEGLRERLDPKGATRR